MDKTRAIRNLRYQLRKKGYTFNKEENICIIPADPQKRAVKQEKRLQELGVLVQYNMFTNELVQKRMLLMKLISFLEEVMVMRIGGNANPYSRLSVSVGTTDHSVINVQIYAHDPGHPERPPIFNSNYYVGTKDDIETIKTTIACI